MKNFLSVLIINTIFIYNGAAASEITNDYEWSTNINSSGVLFRNSLSDKHSIFFGLLYRLFKSNSASNDSNDSYYGAEVGHRYYLDKSSIHRFIDSSFSYRRQEHKSNFNDWDRKEYNLKFMYGLEKLISKEFSIEGAAGIALSFSEQSSNDTTYSGIYIPWIKVGINYYF